MSDCFDHECDAFDSLDYGDRYEDSSYRNYKSCYSYDPLHYFSAFKYVKLIKENQKSYFFSINTAYALKEGFYLWDMPLIIHLKANLKLMETCIGVWLPKKVIRHIDHETKIITIHSATLRKCLHSAFKYKYPELYEEGI